MEYFLFIAGVVLSIAGIIGCIMPALPGPPLSFIALILLLFIPGAIIGTDFLITFGVLTLAVSVLDYLIPSWGAKVFGASRYGVWGSFIGMVGGIFFFPPLGMIIGLLAGAVIGELLAGQNRSAALKAGLGSFLFSLIAMFLKLSLSVVMAYYFFKIGIPVIF